MKTKFFLILVVLACSFLLAFALKKETDGELVQLNIGDSAPKSEVKMQDISGENYSLNDLKKQNGILVVFTCNTCPYVIGSGEKKGWELKYNGLQKTCDEAGIGMVLVNSNEAKRDGADSFKEMKKHAKEKKYTSRYVVDENASLADAFGANKTPHVFLFNKELKLVFKGSIDGRHERPVNETTYLQNALKNLGDGKDIDPNNTKAFGCSIKRVKT